MSLNCQPSTAFADSSFKICTEVIICEQVHELLNQITYDNNIG